MMNTPITKRAAILFADIRAGPTTGLRTHHKPIVASNTTLFYTMPNTSTRIFALDPTTKGFGYAVLELPFRLVEWGLAHISGEKHTGAIARFEMLLDRFRPDAIVLEDAAAPGSRRQPRIRRLIEALAAFARERGIAVYAVARSAILTCFSSGGEQATKHSIAARLAKEFPELQAKLPPARALWESEKERMSIFDALALAVTHASA